jgi:hypothetical protein
MSRGDGTRACDSGRRDKVDRALWDPRARPSINPGVNGHELIADIPF